MLLKRFSFLLFLVLVLSCQTEEEQEVNTERTNSIDEFIRMPTDNGKVDTSEMATLKFDHQVFSFDTIQEGQTVEHVFSFQNTGHSSLMIADVTSTCGCTVPDYPKKPIPAGETSEIKVVFDSKDQSGRQDKKISIFANTFPNETVISMKGYVQEKNN